MNKILVGCIVTAAAGVAAVSIVAARHIPTVKPNTYVGPVAVGGLTLDEASKRLRVWWEAEKLHMLKPHIAGLAKELPPMTPGQLGVGIDDQACVAKLPTDDLGASLMGAISQTPPERQNFDLVYRVGEADLKGIADEVNASFSKPKPARVLYQAGEILRTHEVPAQQLDVQGVPQAVASALKNDGIALLETEGTVELPVKAGPKKVPDEVIDSITDVVSSFSTRFPAWNRPRCSNIKLASSRLNGVILMPGQALSFNGTVGRRTLKGGFKLAGIYKNGKHDVGVGGGICQVSTTLYNTCLLGNLKIKQRSNHSMPVPYVPLGRDATVDYGALDLVVENSYTTPVAISSYYETGRLTFRILGKKDPGLTVRLTQANASSWDPGSQTVVDHTLKPGAKRVVDKGHWGHTVTTYRLVYQDGKLLRRERLGRSFYGGKVTIVAVNPAAAVVVRPGAGAPSVKTAASGGGQQP